MDFIIRYITEQAPRNLFFEGGVLCRRNRKEVEGKLERWKATLKDRIKDKQKENRKYDL